MATSTLSASELLEMITAAETLMLLSTSHIPIPSSSNFSRTHSFSQCRRPIKKVTFQLSSKRHQNDNDDDDEYMPATRNPKRKASKSTTTASHFCDDLVTDLETYKLPLKKRRISFPPTEKTALVKDEVKQKGSSKKNKQTDQVPMPQNVMSVIDAMGGTGVVLMVQKMLTKTDVGEHQNRLQVPFSQIVNNDFLNDDEKQFLTTRDEKNKCNHIETSLLDTRLKTRNTYLRRWVMGKGTSGASSTEVYVLTNTWMDIVRSNGLKAGNVVQVWAFRVDSKLNLALIKL